jgi:hypothetical protein
MFKELKDCNIGDKVILWCIGWRAWDDVVVEVVSIELPFRVNVKYSWGKICAFVPSTECKVVSS